MKNYQINELYPVDFEYKYLDKVIRRTLKKENALAKGHFFWDFWPYDMAHKRIN